MSHDNKFSQALILATAWEVLQRNVKSAIVALQTRVQEETGRTCRIGVFVDGENRTITISDDVILTMATMQVRNALLMPCVEVRIASRMGDQIVGGMDIQKVVPLVAECLYQEEVKSAVANSIEVGREEIDEDGFYDDDDDFREYVEGWRE